MVCPFPYTSTQSAVSRIKFLYVKVQRAWTYAHCVRIFALEIRRSVKFLCCLSRIILFIKLSACIHLRYHVVIKSRRAANSLVMYRHTVKLFELCITIILVFPTARLVAQRPHRHADVVFIAHIHSVYSVPKMMLPSLII